MSEGLGKAACATLSLSATVLRLLLLDRLQRLRECQRLCQAMQTFKLRKPFCTPFLIASDSQRGVCAFVFTGFQASTYC